MGKAMKDFLNSNKNNGQYILLAFLDPKNMQSTGKPFTIVYDFLKK